jgi:hypothetical protein
MADFEGSIPVGMISICDLFEAVYQAITPDWQTLEERLNPSSPYYGVGQNQHNHNTSRIARTGKQSAAMINPDCVQQSGCGKN